MKTQFRVWVFYDQKAKKESAPLSLVQAQIYILNLKLKDFDSHLIWTPGWKGWAKLEEFLDSEQKFFTKLRTPHPKKSRAIKQNDFDLPEGGEGLSALTSEDGHTNTNTMSGRFGEDSMESSVSLDKESLEKTVIDDIETDTQHGKKSKKSPAQPAEFEGQNKRSAYWDPEFSIHDVKNTAHDQHLINIKFERERRKQIRHELQIEILIVTPDGKSFRSQTQNISLSGVLLTKPLPKSFARGFFDLVVINKFEEDPKKSRLMLRCKAVGDLSDPQRLTFMSPSEETLKRLVEFIEIYETKAPQAKSGS